jgi:branched-chain amino acid transport system permease protein
MDAFLQLTISGLANGMVYALVAVGFVIIYKASDVINFAQGEFMLFGAFLSYAFLAQFPLDQRSNQLLFLALAAALALVFFISAGFKRFVPITAVVFIALAAITVYAGGSGSLRDLFAIAATLLCAAGLGLLVERTVLRPLIGEPIISMIMVTIGLSSLLKAVTLGIWGPLPRALNTSLIPKGEVAIGGSVVGLDRVVTIVLAITLLVLLSLFFRYTRDGIAMRAIADDQQAALSMGISIKRVLAVAWAMSAVTAAIGGFMLANTVGVGHEISYIGLKVFPVVILGGLDSIPGAIVGGAIIGLLETYTGFYIGNGLDLIVPYMLLILVLMVRPYGLFGKQIIERV